MTTDWQRLNDDLREALAQEAQRRAQRERERQAGVAFSLGSLFRWAPPVLPAPGRIPLQPFQYVPGRPAPVPPPSLAATIGQRVEQFGQLPAQIAGGLLAPAIQSLTRPFETPAARRQIDVQRRQEAERFMADPLSMLFFAAPPGAVAGPALAQLRAGAGALAPTARRAVAGALVRAPVRPLQQAGLRVAGVPGVPGGAAVRLPSELVSVRITRFLNKPLQERHVEMRKTVEGLGLEYDALAGTRPDEFLLAVEKVKTSPIDIAKDLVERFRGATVLRSAPTVRPRTWYFKGFDDLEAFLRTGEYTPPSIVSPLRPGPIEPLYQTAKPRPVPFRGPERITLEERGILGARVKGGGAEQRALERLREQAEDRALATARAAVRPAAPLPAAPVAPAGQPAVRALVPEQAIPPPAPAAAPPIPPAAARRRPTIAEQEVARLERQAQQLADLQAAQARAAAQAEIRHEVGDIVRVMGDDRRVVEVVVQPTGERLYRVEGLNQLVDTRQVTPVSKAALPPPPPAAAPLPPPPPSLPPAAVPPPPAIPLPPGAAAGAYPQLQSALDRAGVLVEQSAPGGLARFVNRIPLVREPLRYLYPRLTLPRQVHVAFVAEGSAEAELLTEFFGSRAPVLKELEAAFGPRAIKGGRTGVPFLGTAEQARYPAAGTLFDIAQNPSLYTLSAPQRQAILRLQERNNMLLSRVNEGFGTDLHAFPVPEGAAFLSTIDISENALAAAEGSLRRLMLVGRTEPRLFRSGLARWEATPAFRPQTDVEALLAAMDTAKARVAARAVFVQGSGGLTRLDLIEKLHPRLAAKMTRLRQGLATLRAAAVRLDERLLNAVDGFLASPMDDVDLAALRDGLNVRLARGPRAGAGLRQLSQQAGVLRTEIRALQPAWKAADLRPYQRLGAPVWRYYGPQEAEAVRELTRISSNPLAKLLWNIRNVAFNWDLSPMTGVQLPLGFFSDAVGVSGQLVSGLRESARRRSLLWGFQKRALANDIAADMEGAKRFAFYTGRPMIGSTPEEFAGGWLRALRGYSALNEGMFTLVTRVQRRLFESNRRLLTDWGLPTEQAAAVAAEMAGKAMPLANPRLMGLTPGRAQVLQAVLTSTSFLVRPAELVLQGASGLVKAGLLQTVSPQEKLAMRILVRLTGTIAAISVTSNVWSAYRRKADVEKAALDAINPLNPAFMSLTLPSGGRISLGGPFRSFMRALMPRKIQGSDVLVPFAGLKDWFAGKVTPGLSTQIDLLRNRDFYGNRVVSGEFPRNVLDFVLYELEGLLPLTGGAVMEGLRTGRSPYETLPQVISQFAGVSYREETPWRERDMLVQAWALGQGFDGVHSYYQLEPALRKQFREAHPEVFQEIQAENKRRAQAGQQEAQDRIVAEEIVAQYRAWQEADDAEREAGFIDAAEWRERRRERQVQLNAKRDLLFRDVPTPKEPAPWQQYYAKIDEMAGAYNGVMTDEAWEDVEQWVAGLSPEMQADIVRNTGLGDYTATEQEYYAALKQLQPYFEMAQSPLLVARNSPLRPLWERYLKAGALERSALLEKHPELSALNSRLRLLRERYRKINPLLDLLLIRWGYVTEPQTPLGELERQRLLQRKAA